MRPPRSEFPGIKLNRPMWFWPLLVRPREEVQAIRQLDRAVLARENHPRSIRVVIPDPALHVASADDELGGSLAAEQDADTIRSDAAGSGSARTSRNASSPNQSDVGLN